MTNRCLITVVIVAVLTCLFTAGYFFLRKEFTFDPFAEIIVNNASDELISSAEIRQGDLTFIARNIRPTEQRLIRFDSEAHGSSGLDYGYTVTVTLASGRVLRGVNQMGNGEKYTINIRKNSIDTATRQVTTF